MNLAAFSNYLSSLLLSVLVSIKDWVKGLRTSSKAAPPKHSSKMSLLKRLSRFSSKLKTNMSAHRYWQFWGRSAFAGWVGVLVAIFFFRHLPTAPWLGALAGVFFGIFFVVNTVSYLVEVGVLKPRRVIDDYAKRLDSALTSCSAWEQKAQDLQQQLQTTTNLAQDWKKKYESLVNAGGISRLSDKLNTVKSELDEERRQRVRLEKENAELQGQVEMFKDELDKTVEELAQHRIVDEPSHDVVKW